jgi:ABC-2 type transport system permease protein
MNGPVWAPVWALAWREGIRFFRQPHRVVGSVAQPLLIWLFLGSGFAASFRMPGMEDISYMEYFYPGILLMMALFSGIFATITLIEDRSQGLLQEVLVAPIARWVLVLGKVLGALGVAMVNLAVLLCMLPWLGLEVSPVGFVLMLAGLVVATLGFTTAGFVIAWRMESTAGYHAIMSVVLMPLWMLSGALFPVDSAPVWLQGLMVVNPVTHALVLVRMPLYVAPDVLWQNGVYGLAWVVAIGWAGLGGWVAVRRVSRIERGVV